MLKKNCGGLKVICFLSSIFTAGCFCVKAFAESGKINRYKVDFIYQQIGYQILSDINHTVAVCQPYDIDSGRMYGSTETPYWSEVGENGFLFSFGLRGEIVEIPQTVYDEKGEAYTVTDLANGAINYESIGGLVLPNSLSNINSGIVNLPITSLYLPACLKTLSGIHHCPDLKSLYIPWGVESVEKGALSSCGFEMMFFPIGCEKSR